MNSFGAQFPTGSNISLRPVKVKGNNFDGRSSEILEPTVKVWMGERMRRLYLIIMTVI